jgi:hypothetical protein
VLPEEVGEMPAGGVPPPPRLQGLRRMSHLPVSPMLHPRPEDPMNHGAMKTLSGEINSLC